MDSDPGPPLDDGPSDPNPNPIPEPDAERKPQESTEEERLNSLTLDDSGNAAGGRAPPSNGSLPADLFSGDEIEEEELPVASCSAYEVDGAAGEARASSSHDVLVWRENSEQDCDVPPSPSSSGYAGERGSSGESGIEEVDDGGASLDDWSRGKDHRDEVSAASLLLVLPFVDFALRICEIRRLLKDR